MRRVEPRLEIANLGEPLIVKLGGAKMRQQQIKIAIEIGAAALRAACARSIPDGKGATILRTSSLPFALEGSEPRASRQTPWKQLAKLVAETGVGWSSRASALAVALAHPSMASTVARGVVTLGADPIGELDLKFAIHQLLSQYSSDGRRLIQLIPIMWRIDSGEEIPDPRGRTGRTLELSALCVTLDEDAFNRLTAIVDRAGYESDFYMATPLACAFATAQLEELDQEVLCLHIDDGLVSAALVAQGAPRFAGGWAHPTSPHPASPKVTFPKRVGDFISDLRSSLGDFDRRAAAPTGVAWFAEAVASSLDALATPRELHGLTHEAVQTGLRAAYDGLADAGVDLTPERPVIICGALPPGPETAAAAVAVFGAGVRIGELKTRHPRDVGYFPIGVSAAVGVAIADLNGWRDLAPLRRGRIFAWPQLEGDEANTALAPEKVDLRAEAAATPADDSASSAPSSIAAIEAILSGERCPAGAELIHENRLTTRYRLNFKTSKAARRFPQLARALVDRLPASACELTTAQGGQVWLDVATDEDQRASITLDDALANYSVGGTLPIAVGLDGFGGPYVIDLAVAETTLVQAGSGATRKALCRLVATSAAEDDAPFRVFANEDFIAAADIAAPHRWTTGSSEEVVAHALALLKGRRLQSRGPGQRSRPDIVVLLLTLRNTPEPGVIRQLGKIMRDGPGRDVFVICTCESLGRAARDALRFRTHLTDIAPEREFSAHIERLHLGARSVGDVWLNDEWDVPRHLYVPLRSPELFLPPKPPPEPILGERARALIDTVSEPFKLQPTDERFKDRLPTAARQVARWAPAAIAIVLGAALGHTGLAAVSTLTSLVSKAAPAEHYQSPRDAWADIDKQTIENLAQGAPTPEAHFDTLVERAAQLDKDAVEGGYFKLDPKRGVPFEQLQADQDPTRQVRMLIDGLPSNLSESSALTALKALGITPKPAVLVSAGIFPKIADAASADFGDDWRDINISTLEKQISIHGCLGTKNRLVNAFQLKALAPDSIAIPSLAYGFYTALADHPSCAEAIGNLDRLRNFIASARSIVYYSPSSQEEFATRFVILSQNDAVKHLRTFTCGVDSNPFDLYLGLLAHFYLLDADGASACAARLKVVQPDDAIVRQLGIFFDTRIAFWRNRFRFGGYRPDHSGPNHVLKDERLGDEIDVFGDSHRSLRVLYDPTSDAKAQNAHWRRCGAAVAAPPPPKGTLEQDAARDASDQDSGFCEVSEIARPKQSDQAILASDVEMRRQLESALRDLGDHSFIGSEILVEYIAAIDKELKGAKRGE